MTNRPAGEQGRSERNVSMYPTPQRLAYTEHGDMLNSESTLVVIELEMSHFHMLRLAEKLLTLVNNNRNDTHSVITIGGYPQDIEEQS